MDLNGSEMQEEAMKSGGIRKLETRKRLPVPRYKEFGPDLIKKFCSQMGVDAREFCGKPKTQR